MKQAEKIYLISDAAKQVAVEAHVLRYWEEELKLPIKRNELGHRYYTQEDIDRLKEVRDLKERGLQLKAIKGLLTRAETENTRGTEAVGAELQREGIRRHVLMVNKGELLPVQEESREAKSMRLQQLLQTMITEAVKTSNREVCDEIKESLLKELDYQFRLQEEKEDEREMERVSRQEEHYRQIDELIRSYNPGGKRKDKKEACERKKQPKKVSCKDLPPEEENGVNEAVREAEKENEEQAETDSYKQEETKGRRRILSGRSKGENHDKNQNKEEQIKKGIFLKRKRSIV